MENLLTLGKQAISDGNPAGNDVRAEVDFELLQNEIGKMSNPAAGSTVDWQKVATLAGTLLEKKGKDILVASYLAGGWLYTRGLPGLHDGLQVLSDMLETYWETMYPPLPRLRARRNALDWLLDRIRAHGDEHDWSSLPEQDITLVEGLRERLKDIDAILLEKDSDFPTMRSAISQVNSLPIKADVVEEESATVSTAPPRGASAAGQGAALATVPPETAEDAALAVAAALQRLADIALWYGDAGLYPPQAFALNRIAAWAGLDAVPPVRGAHTIVPAPVSQVIEALVHLVSVQDDQSIIRFAEAQLPNFPFWLDLNRVAVQAMERLGQSHDAARREISGHTALLLTRFPGVDELAFAGGMPFADGETRQWLQGLKAGTGIGENGEVPGDRQNGLARVLAKANACVVEDDIAGAATILQQAISQHAAPSAKLQLRIHLCELLSAHRGGAHIDAFADAIMADIDRFELTTWDPPLALSGLQAAYRIRARNDDDKSGADALLARITALDAAAAVRLVT